jgi:mannose-1-phosphate guanylyltransferase
VLAGGGGTRLWPLSRRSHPKQCLSLGGTSSLLRQTVDRLAPLVPRERVLVVTGPDMAAAVRADLPDLPADAIMVEPQGRNTAPCVAWAAIEVARRASPEAPLLVLPADHAVARPAALREALAAAAQAAVDTGALITLGVPPDRPATGFGYLELGPPAGRYGRLEALRVSRFVEKPDLARARAFVEGGAHLWNAGMFAFTARALSAAVAAHLPRTAAALAPIRDDPDALHLAWPETDAISLDFGVMERAANILTMPCDVGWSDLGAWDQVASTYPPVPGGRGLARRVVSVDATDCLVHAPSKAVALVGVRDLVVVDTQDALLVLDRRRAQDVRAILRQLAEAGDDDLL